MKVKDILGFLEALAPTSAAMDFDNVGLLVGSPEAEISRVLLSLDITSEVVEEAAENGCELIVSHHPVIFSPIRSLKAQSVPYLLAQSGIYVPAECFRFDPADMVLTHFPADEDKTLDLGRLGEECQRFREMFAQSTPKSLILLNETFSTTSFEEGYYIAVDAVKAILQKGTRTIYNTHMHKLAKDIDSEINADGAAGKAVSLVAETKDGKNSFRVRIAPPEGKSFAREIAVKYGVTYEALVEG